jgi:exodeoxyribonuclease V alpha subunit
LFTVNFLTYIYRQAENSLIISNAHRINEGKSPVLDNTNAHDFFYSSKESPEEILQTVLQIATERLPKFTGTTPKDIQVLAPLKNGMAGVENLNVELQKKINPPSPGKPELVDGNKVYRIEDKVMQTVNNYELRWERADNAGRIIERGSGVFNGDIGFIREINRTTGEARIEFEDGRVAPYTLFDFRDLTHAYAITIHKSQGSEFDMVIIPIAGGPRAVLNRNLLYTAVTRAKKIVMLVGAKKNIAMVVHNNYTAKRYTLLKRFLLEEKKKWQDLYR